MGSYELGQSFHTFSMVDGPSSYLQSNRENSKRLGKKVKEELGSLGRTLIENLESIENETEFNAGHAFVRPGFTLFPLEISKASLHSLTRKESLGGNFGCLGRNLNP